jgi:CheY-like chemotaxis protein
MTNARPLRMIAPRRTRVLFIERHEDTRAKVLAAFDPLRYELVIAEGVAAAIRLREGDGEFDVLVCELGSAGAHEPKALAGITRRLRRLARSVLFIATDEAQARAFSANVAGDAVLVQPVSPIVLRAAVDRART